MGRIAHPVCQPGLRCVDKDSLGRLKALALAAKFNVVGATSGTTEESSLAGARNIPHWQLSTVRSTGDVSRGAVAAAASARYKDTLDCYKELAGEPLRAGQLALKLGGEQGAPEVGDHTVDKKVATCVAEVFADFPERPVELGFTFVPGRPDAAAQPASSLGVCYRVGAKGAPCTSDDLCETGLTCRGSFCREGARGTGASCVVDEDCAPPDACVGEVCTSPADAGATCERDDLCRGACQAGTCQDICGG